MALKLYNLRPARGAKKNKKRIGRGDSSGHGTYATRGQKGQRSRSGGRGGLKLKGLKSGIQSIPKLGGFKSLKPKSAIVNLDIIDKNYKNGDVIDTLSLFQKGLTDQKYNAKILGDGKITKKVTVVGVRVSQSAAVAIEKAGGKVILPKQKTNETKVEKKS
ncbi:50S ribosomal protein L15 [Candidatus Falkowbacteria bacterium]|nr:50S ribosomal protein L15 [Candidatus Falkowbacteria bacterium]